MVSNDFFTFATGQATDVGCKREVNEDSFLSRPEAGLWVVADGMGGHAGGDFASGAIVKELFSIGLPGSPEDLRARFSDRLARANDTIQAQAQLLDRGMIGATVVALLVHGHDYACIWSGDSRCYLMRDGQFFQQSRDHTEVRALLDANSITEDQARNWPRKNVITQAIGVTETPECDIVSGQLEMGDCFLLCSDGLTEHLEDSEIAHILASYSEQDACDALIRLTLERGAKDNVTVIVMRCLPPPPPAETDALSDDAFGPA